MVNRELLKQGALRAYELGRLRAAARVAWLLSPAVLVCALETGAQETCACIGVLLLTASIYLRWRDRRGADSVRDGLTAGVLPLAIGLILARVAPHWANAPLISLCAAASFSLGLPSGIWLGARLTRRTNPAVMWLVALGIAILTASLGSIALGFTALAGVAGGLGFGVAASALKRGAA